MTTRKMPATVSILGIPFTIEYKPDLRSDDQEVMGLTEGPARKITICSTSNDTTDKMEDTLRHEILHAVLYVSGLAEILDNKMEEAVVLAIENGLSPLYRRTFK